MTGAKRVTASDVADYILKKLGPMSAMKLQKLVYYSQAWSLAWTDRPLFREDIQAWANGPIVPSLWKKHRGAYRVDRGQFEGDAKRLNDDHRETVDLVLDFYGPKNPQWLSDLTHMERPWKKARCGLSDADRGNHVISKASMLEYYSGLISECGQ